MTAGSVTPRAFDVCVVGSANLDLVATTSRLPGPGETVLGREYAEHPGGKGLNQAVAAARAGASVAFCGAVGDDDAGRRLREVASADGIDLGATRVLPDVATGRAMIGVSDDSENFIIVVPGANAAVDAADAAAAASTARVVLVQLEIPLPVVIAALTAARQSGATTVLNPAPAAPLSPEVLALCDVVIPNEHEVELLGGVDALHELGATTVVVTQGARGASLYHLGSDPLHVPAFAVDAIDTTAAGDAFCGGFVTAIAAGQPVADALRVAAATGALATTRPGAVPSLPRRADIDALINASA